MAKIAVTGHRPNKLGGYNNCPWHRAIRRHMRDFLEQAPDGELEIITGCALGIDQMWMEVGLYLDLPVTAAVPFEGFDAKWPVVSQRKLAQLLEKCDKIINVCEPGYHPEKLQRRNEWMVDQCDTLVAYWNGSEGGTQNCVDYAGRQGKLIVTFNPEDLKP